jgi:prefoldin subunit 5
MFTQSFLQGHGRESRTVAMDQYDSVVGDLHKELDEASARIRGLEQECRKHTSMLQELDAIKAELTQSVQQACEWQQKHAYAADPRCGA